MTTWCILVSNGVIKHWGRELFSTDFDYRLLDYSNGTPCEIVVKEDEFVLAHAKMLQYETLGAMNSVLKLANLPPVVLEEKQPTEWKPVVAVTGHRPDKLGGYKIPNPTYDKVVLGLAQAFEHYKPAQVITGMSLGTDQWAAELCLNMGIPFVAAIPFEGQDSKWPSYSKSHYQWLLSKAAAKYIVSPGGYEGWKMQKRNEWMVNNCHGVIAVFNGTPGGTANCLGYAAQVGKPVYYVPLDPAGMPIGQIPVPMSEPKKEEPKVTQETKRVIEL